MLHSISSFDSSRASVSWASPSDPENGEHIGGTLACTGDIIPFSDDFSGANAFHWGVQESQGRSMIEFAKSNATWVKLGKIF